MGEVPEYNAFAAARHVLERIAELHPEFGELPVSRDDADWPAWLDRVGPMGTYLSDGERLLLEIGTGLWTERLPIVQQLVRLDEDNRARVLRALVALCGATGELSGGQVVDGRFGPQFTVGERVVIAEALAAFIGVAKSLEQSGLFPAETTAGMSERNEGVLRDFIARLQS